MLQDEEAPVEEAPVEEAPVEEAPAEETTEEAPAEGEGEAPAEGDGEAPASYAADWNYKTNGADWPSLEIENNECGDAA